MFCYIDGCHAGAAATAAAEEEYQIHRWLRQLGAVLNSVYREHPLNPTIYLEAMSTSNP